MSLVQETEKPEGEVVAVSVNSSRSAVLANQQLLAIILDAFSGDDLCLDRRKTLLAAALSCRVLYEPAMDCLWGSIHDLTPLFQLVPGATIQGQQYHLASNYSGQGECTSLQRFFAHARRIRGTKLSGWTSHFSAQFYTELTRTLRSLPTTSTTFSRLHNLHISPTSDSTFLALSLLLDSGSQIQTVHLDAIGEDGDQDYQITMQCLLKLASSADALKHLKFEVPFSGVDIPHLQSFERVLAGCRFEHRNLTTIDWVVQTRAHSTLVSVTLRSASHFDSFGPLIAIIADFGPKWESLHIPPVDWKGIGVDLMASCSTRPAYISKILQTRHEILTSVNISRRGHPLPENEDWAFEILEPIFQLNPSSLRQLTLHDSSTSFISQQALQSLTQLSSLVRIRLTGKIAIADADVSLSDTFLMSLITDCSPNLRSLHLPCHRPKDRTIPFTMDILQHLSQSSSNIESFAVSIDSSAPPERFPWATLSTNAGSTALRRLKVNDCRSSNILLAEHRRIAIFLHRLFPKLQSVEHVADSERTLFIQSWSFIEELRRDCQKYRIIS